MDLRAFKSTAVPGVLELMERGDVAEHEIPVDDVVSASGARGLDFGLSFAEIRMRWDLLVNRLRGYRRDRVLVDREPCWLPLFELQVPPNGKATLRYEQRMEREKGAAVKILGSGFGTSESISIERSVELEARATGKSLDWRMYATVTRYVDKDGGPPLLRMDVTGGDSAECRVRDLPPIEPVTGPMDTDEWRVINRVDLSSSADSGSSTWTYRMTRRATWGCSIGAAPLHALGIDALKVESDRSEEFEVAFDLPYGGDYIFYCRKGEWPISPRCAMGATPNG